ncbi:AMP-dependent synthetase/ligase [Antrihabitans stalactiti]
MDMTENSFKHESGANVTTLTQAFQETIKLRPDAVALRTVGDTQTITWKEYAERVEKLAGGLAALGVSHGDTVGIMLTNRPEFHLVDTAALHLGATPFSIYNTYTADQIQYLFSNAGNRVVITEPAFLDRIRNSGVPLDHIVLVGGQAEGTITLAELEATPAPEGFDFEASWKAVQPDDVCTLIYTSGTTGPPKGVETTHRNLAVVLDSLEGIMQLNSDDRVASYLPSAHIADRATSTYANIARGIQVTTVADPREIAAALPDVRPTVFFGVPRVWQKVKQGIEAKVAAAPSPVKQKLGGWALGLATDVATKKIEGKSVSPILNAQHALADKLVLSKVREALGLDQLRYAFSGASAIPKETLEFFYGLGIVVQEVWGMSESTGLSTMTLRDDLKFGTVGKPAKGVNLKLADDGEILLSGATIMKGYRNQPEKTAEDIRDGWLHTGDIGEIDADGYVKIVDRKKELIINESGKNMSPTNIENAMKSASSLIGPVVAIGDNKPYIAAIVVLDPDAAAGQAKALGIPEADIKTIAARQEIKDAIAKAVRAGNEKLARVEQVKRFIISDTAWEPGGDELTPTMKLRRKPIAEKYASEIEALYAKSASGEVVDLSK